MRSFRQSRFGFLVVVALLLTLVLGFTALASPDTTHASSFAPNVTTCGDAGNAWYDSGYQIISYQGHSACDNWVNFLSNSIGVQKLVNGSWQSLTGSHYKTCNNCQDVYNPSPRYGFQYAVSQAGTYRVYEAGTYRVSANSRLLTFGTILWQQYI
jgi:hypothetical protein